MTKFFFTSLILLLIFLTAFTKNSTKRIDDEIFVIEENIRLLKKDFENIKLEHNFLSSTEKLIEFKKLYFDDELVEKNINEIKIIHKRLDKIEIRQLRFFNEQ
tara:strand:- start:448 stop:756 length:309 start_codon:yes stop_codon:yes gene_type:complete